MTEFTLPMSTGSSRAALTTHPVHRATALLRKALHGSRRATFTQEFGEVRGIHRLSSPPSAEVFVEAYEMADFVSPPSNLAFVGAYLGTPGTGTEGPGQESPRGQDGPHNGLPGTDPHGGGKDTAPDNGAERQLRGLIRDFKERQRRAGLIVAGSITAAVTLTFLAIALLFVAAATDGATVHESVGRDAAPARDVAATPRSGA
ncbi:hypothetical protein AUC68_08705 [Methyloceanibacter methanicus]|uniref:Uncharacterized protein n=1 Tax=Methyloceanibacter methanicus TaxID=1774968 RepID=A0A1E3VY65_9HYPH|nr:hypothetical protein [Methyloceanibacter methanicus]ODR98495.1 hypothetical protein AUC68_08705 [Methyloceanibacter methanicus]